MVEPTFEVFYLDGFSWTDLIDALRVPHYTNEHAYGDMPVRHYRQRQMLFKHIAGDVEQIDLLVIWSGDTEPTDEEVTAQMTADHAHEEDDDLSRI